MNDSMIHNLGGFTTGRIVLRASDHQMLSDEATLSIQAVSKQAPRLLRKAPLVVTSGETVTLDTIDIQVSRAEEEVAISVLQGTSCGQAIIGSFVLLF